MQRTLSLLRLTFIFLALFTSVSSVTAQRTTYSIRYTCFTSTKQPLKGDDSIKIINNGKTTVAPFSLPDSITVVNSFLTCKVEGDKDSAVLKHISPRSIVTMFYRYGIWSFNEDGKRKELSPQIATYETTTEKRKLLGYWCTKVIMTTNDDIMEVWIARDLPGSLMPIGGYKPLEGAIMELYSSKTSLRLVAENIDVSLQGKLYDPGS